MSNLVWPGASPYGSIARFDFWLIGRLTAQFELPPTVHRARNHATHHDTHHYPSVLIHVTHPYSSELFIFYSSHLSYLTSLVLIITIRAYSSDTHPILIASHPHRCHTRRKCLPLGCRLGRPCPLCWSWRWFATWTEHVSSLAPPAATRPQRLRRYRVQRRRVRGLLRRRCLGARITLIDRGAPCNPSLCHC